MAKISIHEALKQVAAVSPIASFAVDKNHRITHWNTAMEALSGVKYQDMLGTDKQWQIFYDDKRPTMADMIVDELSPDEIGVYYTYSKFKKSTLIKDACEAERLFAFLGGEGRWLHSTATPIRNGDGEIIGAVQTIQDVTDQRRAEEALYESENKFRSLFESARDAIWINDNGGTIQTANNAAALLTGYSVEELRGMNIASLLDTKSQHKYVRIMDRLLNSKPVFLPYELSLKRRDGSEIICMISTNVISGSSDPTSFQSIVRDVTEEKQQYETARFYLQEITKAQEEERRRISRELHDSTAQNLIALLHQIDNLLADRTNLPVKEAKALWSFHEQIKNILEEVRRFSRDLRPSIIDDLGLVPALEWLCSELNREYGIDVAIKVSGEEQRLAPETELLFFRIAQEALNNTVKHAHTSEAKITVKSMAKTIRLTISDNGTGFKPPSNLESLTHLGKLGLAGMQERVQLLNGTLKIDSKPDKGTVITVDAPLRTQ